MTEDDIVLAGELALGVLDGDERAAALRRVPADPGFAREVAQWRARLDELHAEWPDADPGIQTERRVRAIPGGGDARGVWAGWRWVAAIASAAAAAMLVLVVARPPVAPAPPPPVAAPAPLLVTVLQPRNGAPVAVTIDPRRRTARLGGALIVPDGRVAELWLIASDGVPRAAGLAPNGIRRLSLRHGVAPTAGVTLAVSIEPSGGSPKATPTGPVIATGTLALS